MPSLELADPSLFIETALIGGTLCPSTSGKTLEVDDPATGSVIGTIPSCDRSETRAAIDAAAAAFEAWRFRTANDRAAILERWHDLVIANSHDLARIITAEQGKPLKEAEGEIHYAASFIRWFAAEGRRISGRSVPAPQTDRRVLVMKEPIGVSAAITPWNFPAAMITRKCAPALAAGCPVVVKPSELTPYSALALARLAERAGFPAGVLNIVTGWPEAIGAELTSNATVRMLSFTGSTRVGALLMRKSADTIKRLSLELGGNAPLIVFDDADIDLAVAGAMARKFRNDGQTCVCANRILVQEKVYDAFAARLGRAVENLTVGLGRLAGSTIGPLINMQAVTKVRAHMDDALAHGAVVSAMATVSPDLDARRFFTPVVLTGATASMRMAREETFGPTAPLFRFRHEADGIAMANATPFGLVSYFYTENHHRAWPVAERLEAGLVALNTGSVAMEVSPFGGTKQSGLGREGGQEGIEEYLELKTFHIGGLKFSER